MKVVLWCLFFVKLISADTLIIKSPTENQIFNESSIITLDYLIQRNGMLYINNITSELINTESNTTHVHVHLQCHNQNGTEKVNLNTDGKIGNFSLIVTGHGYYNYINGTTTTKLSMNISQTVNYQVVNSSNKLSSGKRNTFSLLFMLSIMYLNL